MDHLENIYSFKTANFVLEVNALTEHDPDFSFDETGDILNKVNNGELLVFCAQCVIYTNDFDRTEIASTYLGDCIYKEYRDFRDHLGINKKSKADNRNYGSYFSDMVRETCKEARLTI